MSTELYCPKGFDEGLEGSHFGTIGAGRFRWVPTWYGEGWDNEFQQQALIQWLTAHPTVEVPTDQGTWTGLDVLERIGPHGGEPGLHEGDLRAHLERMGRL